MTSKHLATYLNDHLAGSSGLLELLDHVSSARAGREIEQLAKSLYSDVLADRKELEELMSRLQIAQSTPRKMSAWLAEKMAQIKLHFDDRGGGAFWLLEAAEAISVGVEGKRLLWISLSTTAESTPPLRGPDYDHLIRRAEEQRTRVEPTRRQAAGEALRDNEAPQ